MVRVASLVAAAGILAIAAQPVLADAAPPPYLVELRLSDAAASRPIVAVELRHCSDAACQQTEPLSKAPVYGRPESIACGTDRCEAWVDPYASDRLQLIIQYPDGTFRSNPFSFARYLVVDTRSDGLLVGPDKSGMLEWFIDALVVTLILELAIGLAYVIARRRFLVSGARARVLLVIAIGNLVSLPIVWYGIPALGLLGAPSYLLGELVAWLLEAALLFLAARPAVTRRSAIALSLAMNGVSAGAFLALLAAVALPCSGLHCDPLPLPW